MLTEVEFHTGVPDPVMFTCRLLRKAQRQGHGAWVTGDVATLAHLDERLWTFDPASFIPHLLLVPADLDEAPASGGLAPTAAGRLEVLNRTPIWLAERAEPVVGRTLLVHIVGALADTVSNPPQPRGWQRAIEIVGAGAGVVSQGRERWRAWRAAGVNVVHHPAAMPDA